MGIKLYADGANLEELQNLRRNPRVEGFTTNPTLMRKAGVTDYLEFAHKSIEIVHPLPISFEVIADDDDEIIRQARKLSSIYENVFVKLPVTNTKSKFLCELAAFLNSEGIKLNITAIMTVEQVLHYIDFLSSDVNNIFSVFCGRIADSGVDPVAIMSDVVKLVSNRPNWKSLWASPREILNYIQAEQIGCDIITMTPDLWSKMPNIGKSLQDFSLETVTMFFNDARSSGFSI